MTTSVPPPGWYPDPEGPGWRYWDGRQWTLQSPAPPSGGHPTQEQPRRISDRTVALIVGFLLVAVIVGSIVAERQKESKSSNAKSTTPTTQTTQSKFPAFDDSLVAGAAREYVLQSFAMPPGSDFIDYVCPPADAGTANCWVPYVTKFTYRSGVLRVFMQVDRRSPEGKELGESAAHAIMNFIKLGTPPSILINEVDWVETVDGTGVHIAQYSL